MLSQTFSFCTAFIREIFDIAAPKNNMDIIHARLKIAEALAKELRNEKKAH
jgi:hypothetical protein